MPTYRKLPLVIDAIQFTGENRNEVMDWANVGYSALQYDGIRRFADHILVTTLNGDLLDVWPGDWVIRELNDPTRFYPCKDEAFTATYEAYIGTEAVA